MQLKADFVSKGINALTSWKPSVYRLYFKLFLRVVINTCGGYKEISVYKMNKKIRLGQRTDKGPLVFFTLIFLLRIKTAVKIRLLALTNAGAEDYNKTVH